MSRRFPADVFLLTRIVSAFKSSPEATLLLGQFENKKSVVQNRPRLCRLTVTLLNQLIKGWGETGQLVIASSLVCENEWAKEK